MTRHCLLPGLLLALTLSGCSSASYFPARAKDLGDCFQARAAFGLGLYAEVEATSLLHPSVGFADTTLAPRFSVEWDPRRRDVKGELRAAAFPTLLLGWPFYGYHEAQSGYADTHPYWRGFLAPWILMGNRHVGRTSNSLLWLHSLIPNARLEDPSPDFADEDPPPPGAARKLADHTWLAISATPLVVRLDLGWNPLETIDFVLGLLALDILGDDDRRPENPTPSAEQASRSKATKLEESEQEEGP